MVKGGVADIKLRDNSGEGHPTVRYVPAYSFTGITFNTSCKEIDAICDQTIHRCKYPDMESYLNDWANVQFGLIQCKTPDNKTEKTKIVTLTPQQ